MELDCMDETRARMSADVESDTVLDAFGIVLVTLVGACVLTFETKSRLERPGLKTFMPGSPSAGPSPPYLLGVALECTCEAT